MFMTIKPRRTRDILKQFFEIGVPDLVFCVTFFPEKVHLIKSSGVSLCNSIPIA
jgi:hypothetical protein